MKDATFNDLTKFVGSNEDFKDLRIPLEREIGKKKALNSQLLTTTGPYSALVFTIRWPETPEGREWWFDWYMKLKKLED
jgi:hypothetical protein